MAQFFVALALVTAAVLLPGRAALAATGYTLETIALEGSPAPGTSDAFGDFLDVALDEAGRVAFAAPLSSGFPNGGVWVDAGAGPVLRTRNGHAAPAPHAGSFLAFGGYTRLDGSGGVAYGAILTGGVDGLFLDGTPRLHVEAAVLDGPASRGGTRVLYEQHQSTGLCRKRLLEMRVRMKNHGAGPVLFVADLELALEDVPDLGEVVPVSGMM